MFLNRKNDWFHTLIVKSASLGEVDNVEADLEVLKLKIVDFEEKPLRVTFGINVVLQNEIVFSVDLLSIHAEEIATFKSTIELN